MGLDCSHEAWHGAYSAFDRWRNKIAEVGGYALEKGEYGIEYPALNWDIYTEKNLWGDWKKQPADPLLVLIVHYDSEGVIHPAQAEPLARRLEELIDKLPEEKDPGHIGDWREKTQKFIDGLRRAYEAGEDLEFH